jgi:hypothetical protein
MKIKYLYAFFVNGLFMTQRAEWPGTTRIKVWCTVLEPNLRHVRQHGTNF